MVWFGLGWGAGDLGWGAVVLFGKGGGVIVQGGWRRFCIATVL